MVIRPQSPSSVNDFSAALVVPPDVARALSFLVDAPANTSPITTLPAVANTSPSAPVDPRASYIAAGWKLVRIPPMAKAPVDTGWPSIDYPIESFAPGDNTGVKLGAPSGGLVDVDLDDPHAVRLAPLFLPGPTATFGRASKPRSHWLYVCATKTRRPSRACVELRSTGLQTVLPGSIHPSSEAIEWTPGCAAPMRVDPGELTAAFGRLAGATIIARAWPSVQDDRGAHGLAGALAGMLRNMGWSEDDARDLILPAAEVGGGPDNGHRAKFIAATFADGDKNRTGFPEVARVMGDAVAGSLRQALELVPAVSLAVTNAAASFGALTDVGNSERFAAEYEEDLRYCPGLGWLRWDGTRWREMGKQEPVAEAIASVRRLGALAAASGDAIVSKWATQSEARSKIDAMIGLAKAQPALSVDASDLDRDPWLLNTPNGTIDLRTGQLREHRREDLITKITGCPVDASESFDPTRACPRFERFLDECMSGDRDLVCYLLRSLGYALTGVVREQGFDLWDGEEGSNGKGVTLRILRHMLGKYIRIMEASAFMRAGSRDPNAPSSSLYGLRGVRLAIAQETGDGQSWDEALLKLITGGDAITARKPHAPDDITFDPTHKLIYATNHLPRARGRGGSLWRRVRRLRWAQSFEKREQLDLDDVLRSEAPGILRLLVEGCRAWQRIGLAPPQSMLAAREEYRANEDTIGQFLAEQTAAANGYVPVTGRVLVSALWARFGQEHRRDAERLGRTHFNKELERRKYVRSPETDGGNRHWIGLVWRAS